MKIGPLKITWDSLPSSRRNSPSSLSDAELQNAFRVAEDTLWFRAVLQVIGKVERAQIVEGRIFAGRGSATECVNATGGGAACEMIVERLVRLREESVKGGEE